MVDRYTKIVLTIIAITLVWIAAQGTVTNATAARGEPQAVFIAEISAEAAQCIAGHLTWFKGDTGPCIAMW